MVGGRGDCFLNLRVAGVKKVVEGDRFCPILHRPPYRLLYGVL